MKRKTVGVNQTPEHLLPRLGNLPISDTTVTQTAVMTQLGRLSQADQAKPKKEIGQGFRLVPPSQAAADIGPALGVLLTQEQGWRVEGITLGELQHSLCLAPGEITQIAITTRKSSVSQKSRDTAALSERLVSSDEAQTDQVESQEGGTSETSDGGSSSESTSSNKDAGVSFLGGLGGSAGEASTATSAFSTQYQVGQRNVALKVNQNVHEQARQKASLARSQQETSVREVSERESTELSTRVVANYNHMHALTMQYYEVIQVRTLSTKTIAARRLIFIPIRPIDFSKDDQLMRAVQRFRSSMIETALEQNWTEIALALTWFGTGAEPSSPSGETPLNPKMEDLRTLADDIIRRHKDALQDAKTTYSRLVIARREQLRAKDTARIKTDSLAESAAAQDELAAANRQVKQLDTAYHQHVQEANHLQDLAAGAQTTLDALPHATSDQAATLLKSALIERSLEFNQGIWMREEPARWAEFLAGRKVRASLDEASKEAPETEVLLHVNPSPVAVSGNRVAFEWPFQDEEAEARFEARHVGGASTLKHSVPMATGGLFAEAVLGASNSAEKIDHSRFWNWADALPPLSAPQISTLKAPEHRPLVMPTTRAAASELSQRDLALLRAETQASAVLAAAGNPETFRDQSRHDSTVALAKSAQSAAVSGSRKSRQLAQANFEEWLDLQMAVAKTLVNSQSKTKLDSNSLGGAINARTKSLAARTSTNKRSQSEKE